MPLLSLAMRRANKNDLARLKTLLERDGRSDIAPE
jgi:hypothetical protein